MKLSILCDAICLGGISRVALTLADGLVKKGLSAEVAAVHRESGISMISPMVNVSVIGCTSQPLALLSPFSGLAGYLKRAKPDVLLSMGHSTNCLAAWAKLSRRFPFRLIVSEHSAFATRMAGDAKFHQWRRVVRARFLYRQAEACVCVSNCVADELAGMNVIPRDKAVVIYNPASSPEMAKQIQEPVDDPWLTDHGDGKSRTPVIMSVGRLLGLKGIDILITAFRKLREMGVSAGLMIIGDGPDRNHLETMVRDTGIDGVRFIGGTANPYAYMARASLVVISSYYEGFPMTLVEALGCGVNVVSTDCRCGPREILEGGKWGRLVPVGDPDAMALAMREALNAPLPSEALTGRAAYFSTERAVGAYYNLIMAKRS
ncbi:glycosyl transferase [Synergistales bacterium]|nr:glycosyl transferase [Synergistales bacterium]